MIITESILVILADDFTDENILAALVALQSYEIAAFKKVKGWNHTYKEKRVLNLRLYLVYGNESHYLLFDRCLTSLVGIKKQMSDFGDIHYDCIIPLSMKQAKKLGAVANQPISDSLAILLGGEGGSLPDVSNLLNKFSVTTDVLLDMKLLNLNLRNNHFDVITSECYNFTDFSKYSMTLEQRINAVYSAKCVIGYSSFETYLASALHKSVLEIQSDRTLYKWSNKKYMVVTDDTNKEAVVKGINLCLQQICEESIPTVVGMSSVQDAPIM